MKLHIFTFNPFSENTYIVSGDDGQCVIIDPGCYDQEEFATFQSYIQDNELKPTKVVLTHAHLDHVFSLKRCLDAYQLEYFMHDMERPVLDSVAQVGQMYGVYCDAVDQAHKSLHDGDMIDMGSESWKVLFTPGHSPGSVCFYQKETKQLIGGDVLFRDSIGRTDLPGGHHETLLTSIREKLYVLEEDVVVYSGHGEATTIGHEKKNNPFVRGE